MPVSSVTVSSPGLPLEQLVIAREIGRRPLGRRQPVVEPGQRAGLSAFSAPSEDLDRAAVVRAGGERATDRELDACDR